VIILDTHVLIWWLSEPKKLSKNASRALKTTKRIGIPAIVTWEFAMLLAKGRIQIDRPALDWLQTALAEPRVELLPLTPSIAVQSTRLGVGFHGDPADGLIVATAQIEGVPLVTKDQRMLDYEGVETIWD
jgi:PIN domain nuclease of toxin-antitoxin system